MPFTLVGPLVLCAVSALAKTGAPPAARHHAAAQAPSGKNAAPVTPTAALPGTMPEVGPGADPETQRAYAQARVHFEAGNDQYAAGRYLEAIKSFQAGYALVPRPNFLVNIGQAYRKLGNLTRAKEAYVAYLRALPENSPLRDQALQVLAEIEVQLQEQREKQDADSRSGLTPAEAATTAPSVPIELAKPATASPRMGTWLGIGVGGVGLALVATGGVLELRAKNAGDALEKASRMAGTFDPDQEALGKRSERIGNALLATGGVVMAAGLLLYLVVDQSSANAAAARHPTLAIGRDHLGLGWRF